MHEETGKHGEDRAADGADRRLKQYGADCETTGHLRAQALEYQAADGSAHGTDNRIIKRAESKLRDLGEYIAADRAGGNLDDDIDDRRRGTMTSPP
jgi:hypothetical protein